MEVSRWDQLATRKGRTLFRKKRKVSSTPDTSAPEPKDTRPGERLQKIIAASGYCSRRKAEELILLGAVKVNGVVVSELGAKANTKEDVITVEGKTLDIEPPAHVYFLLNKPRSYVSTTSDPQGRPTVMDLLKSVKDRVYPVGRLDFASEGLLLFTNDGELAHKLMHPSSRVKRTYTVKVRGHVSDHALGEMRDGVQLADGFVKPLRVWRGGSLGEKEWINITVVEGKNLEIRRIFAALGLEVERLRRVAIGPLKIDRVGVGKFVPLLRREVEAVLNDAQGDA